MLAAALTWNVVKGMLFIGLPSWGIVQQVCIDGLACYQPDNPIVLVLEWPQGAPSFITAAVKRSDGVIVWTEAGALPPYQG